MAPWVLESIQSPLSSGFQARRPAESFHLQMMATRRHRKAEVSDVHFAAILSDGCIGPFIFIVVVIVTKIYPPFDSFR